MRALFQLMVQQHGVASTAQARERRAMAASLTRGVRAISHGAAARLHRLDGFERHATVDVLGVKCANPHERLGVRVHRTRGQLDGHIVDVDRIPTLDIPATLALLAPAVGIGPTAKALDSALRLGASSDELRAVATAWREPGRSGPPALLMLLGERVDKRLPRSWFQRVAHRVLVEAGISLADEFPYGITAACCWPSSTSPTRHARSALSVRVGSGTPRRRPNTGTRGARECSVSSAGRSSTSGGAT